jgi:peptidylprolyl isomerase
MVRDGQTATVHYKGMLDDGSVFDSSEGRQPLTFQVGSGQVVPGFENAIRDMEVGETRTVEIGRDDAYGEVREEMIGVIPKDRFPDDAEPEPGMVFEMHTDEGTLPIEVVDVSDEGVTVDGNHPLAGEDLTFEITLLKVA